MNKMGDANCYRNMNTLETITNNCRRSFLEVMVHDLVPGQVAGSFGRRNQTIERPEAACCNMRAGLIGVSVQPGPPAI